MRQAGQALTPQPLSRCRERACGSEAHALRPETKYAKSGDVHIAYQVIGDGPIDLVYIPAWCSHVEYAWESPRWTRWLLRLASFSRLIWFDKRGTGLSDRVSVAATLEQRIDDLRAVMDAVGSERAALFGACEGGPMCALFAATYPERTQALILYATFATQLWAPDYPWGRHPEAIERAIEEVVQRWGKDPEWSEIAPLPVEDRNFRLWAAQTARFAASPSTAAMLTRMYMDLDIRHVLPTIRVPTLLLHRTDDPQIPVDVSRYMASRFPGAKLVELPGAVHPSIDGDFDTLLDEVEAFLTGVHHAPEPDRVLATLLFTDIVGSTERPATLGDHRWRALKESHHAIVRRRLEQYRGREIDTAGDDFFATFDGPARAVRCAREITESVRELGIEVRAGVHTGEVELQETGVTGIAVHIGARVMSMAGPSEALASRTVKDLVAGSGLHFTDRGAHVLKGVPGEWRIFAMDRDGP